MRHHDVIHTTQGYTGSAGTGNGAPDAANAGLAFGFVGITLYQVPTPVSNISVSSPRLLNLESASVKKACLRLIWLSLALGAMARIYQYLLGPSYWGDEAAIIRNVFTRSWRQLLQPLDYAQAAPPLFLLLHRVVYLVLGPSELAMRLPSLLMGLAAMIILAILAWRYLPPTCALLAVSFFAFLDVVIFQHSFEVKQYSADMLMSVLLLLAAVPPVRWPGAISGAASAAPTGMTPARRLLPTAFLAALALGFSFPTLFVFPAISLAAGAHLLGGCARSGGRPGRRVLAVYMAANLLFLASFAAMYALVLRQPTNERLMEFWRTNNGFPDCAGLHAFGIWAWHTFIQWISYPLKSWALGIVVLALLIAGGIGLWRSGRRWLLGVFLLALSLNLLAAFLHRYPFAGNRLALYLLPVVLLIMAVGAEPLLLPGRDRLARWWWILPAVFLGASLMQTVRHVIRPESASSIRHVVPYVRAHYQAGDALYLLGDPHAVQTALDQASGRNVEFLCYWLDPPPPVHYWLPDPPSLPSGERAFWIVVSVKNSGDLSAALGQIIRCLSAVAVPLDDERIVYGGAAAVRFARR